jgi:hypothetical protein
MVVLAGTAAAVDRADAGAIMVRADRVDQVDQVGREAIGVMDQVDRADRVAIGVMDQVDRADRELKVQPMMIKLRLAEMRAVPAPRVIQETDYRHFYRWSEEGRGHRLLSELRLILTIGGSLAVCCFLYFNCIYGIAHTQPKPAQINHSLHGSSAGSG